MAQFLELVFMCDERIEQDLLRAKLAETGVTGKEWSGHLKGGGFGRMAWARLGGPVDLHVAIYHGIWDKYFVRADLDSAMLRNLPTLDARKRLVDDLLALGRHLWESFPFYEGDLAPEEEGWFLYSLRHASAEEMRRGLPRNSYARFLSPGAAELAQIQRWVPQAHPRSIIGTLQREGLLVIWDASNEGLARFLSEEFSFK